MTGSEFLNKKYPDLPGSKPVERAVQKLKRAGEKIPHQREERTEAYLDRLESIMQDKTGLANLKHLVLDTYTTKPDEIPESYWKLQERIMRERGQAGDWDRASPEQKEEIKRQNSEGVLADQRASLEQWVDYFSSSDSHYVPKALKYWVFRNVLGLQEYDKEKKEFPKRSRGTIKQFPDINHEALGYIVNEVVKKYEGKPLQFEHDIQPEERKVFEQFLAKEDFAKLYAWANDLMNPIPEHLLPITEGGWRVYEQGGDPAPLVQSIRGKGTGWCTAGEHTAKSQLQAGDFHVFYSLDDDKKPTIPRIAIRMEGDHIAEVRGVAYKQNLDPYMADVLAEKLEAFPDKEQYLRKDADMKFLTDIENKMKNGGDLDKTDLAFLYELERPIQGFGYQKDPRIEELRRGRKVEEDLPVIFECAPDQIAHGEADLASAEIKAYVGPLFDGFFKKLPISVRHVYERFPDKPIVFKKVTLGGKSLEILRQEITRAGMKIGSNARGMLGRVKVADIPENVEIVILSVYQLGFPKGAKRIEIYATAEEMASGARPGKAQQLGLDIAPAEVGPQLRLQYADQPSGEWFMVGMEPMPGSDGGPAIFGVAHFGDERWLDYGGGGPDDVWDGGSRFAFLLRK